MATKKQSNWNNINTTPQGFKLGYTYNNVTPNKSTLGYTYNKGNKTQRY